MPDGMEATSVFASFKSLQNLCLWGLHVAEIKDGGISIDNTNTKQQRGGRLVAFQVTEWAPGCTSWLGDSCQLL